MASADPQDDPNFDTPIDRGTPTSKLTYPQANKELQALLAKPSLSPGEANRAKTLLQYMNSTGQGEYGATQGYEQKIDQKSQAYGIEHPVELAKSTATRQHNATIQDTTAAATNGPYGPNAFATRDAGNRQSLGLSNLGTTLTQQGALGLQGSQNQAYIQGLNGLAQQQVAAGQSANSADQLALGGYMSATDPLMAMRTAGMGSTYASNPADLAAQQQALRQLQGIAGGSLDYQSQGAQAYADPRYIAQQEQILGQLQGAAGGSLDVQSLAAKAGASPETIAKQKQALDKLYQLSDPTVTANERFMYEQLRRASESDEASYRDAVMQDLSQRGMSSGAAVLGNQLSRQQQLGNERVLGELGIQAQAVQRSQQALGMYVDQQGKLRSQEFDEAFSRAAAGDQMAIANANRKLQAMGMSADQINAMRNASFDEAYKRGLASDAASANNQQTRLSGSVASGNQANAIRSANDAVGFFNTEQSNIMQRHADDFAQQEAYRTGNLANTRLGNQTTVNDTGYNRTTTGINAQAGALTTGQGVNTDLNNKTIDVAGDQFARDADLDSRDLQWQLGGSVVTGADADRQIQASESFNTNRILDAELEAKKKQKALY